ncbi:unnamed protein product [Gongylonema pulchrum]|uniref:Serine/threonine-protein kinase receptor n=1 Tax=Gongylonema pulchrum TaxID=637853 RepID=A0A183DUL1_9BILA|nr:unnamed protein product [Gongylonema pulchrum]
MHDGNLGNCDNSQCIADERPTGHGSAALFCCCSTHHCNRRVLFPPQRISTHAVMLASIKLCCFKAYAIRNYVISAAPTTDDPAELEDPGILGTGSRMFAIIILGLFSLCVLVLFCYYSYREYRNSQHYKQKSADAFSLPTVGDAKAPLIESGNKNGVKSVTNLEPVTRGRFGEVSRGMLGNIPVAVKIFPAADANSWIAEQEIYTIPSLRKHDNILRYFGAEVHDNDFWLITEFHDNGSLYDFIKYRTLTLRESLKVIATMLRGLSFLHEEKMIDGCMKPCIVHRDFKSRNVLLKPDLTSVIADFGLALKCENGQMPSEKSHGQASPKGSTVFSVTGFCKFEQRFYSNRSIRSLCFRDFKSRNVLLKPDLTSVIADFGLALKCENGQMPSEKSHGQVGTRRYMSPEVLEGATEFTAFAFRQIDVYAAALVLWEVLSRTAMGRDDELDEYQRPYEKEAGSQPTLHELRRVVVAEKKRPCIRDAVKEHNIGGVLWKTAEDMWDMEPDGRITSGCAFERANTLYMSYANDLKLDSSPQQPPKSSFHSFLLIALVNVPPPPYSQDESASIVAVPMAALLIKDGSLGSNGFHPSVDEYTQACPVPAPNNGRCFSGPIAARQQQQWSNPNQQHCGSRPLS